MRKRGNSSKINITIAGNATPGKTPRNASPGKKPRNASPGKIQRNATAVRMVTEHDESFLFNQRIKKWGQEFTTCLLETRVLVIGLNGLSSEVVKNLLTSGMRCFTILDDTVVSESDSSANVFCSTGELGKKRSEASLLAIQELNTNSQILIETGDPAAMEDTFYAGFKVIFATGLPVDLLGKINRICRDNNGQFYCGDTWGYYGYCFLDLNHHKFFRHLQGDINPPAKQIAEFGIGHKTERIVEEELHYVPFINTLVATANDGLKQPVNKVFILLHIMKYFQEMFARCPDPANRMDDMIQLPKIKDVVCKELRIPTTEVTNEMLSSLFGELSPVCTAVGGILASEIIKGISRSGLPIYNYFLFDGIELTGVNELIKSELDD